MNRIVLGAVALIAAGWTVSAQAADLSYGTRAPYTVNQPLNVYSWAGPYLGANLGYGWGSVDNNPTKPSGFEGGIQAGYNWQAGPWVFGVEGDIQATAADDTSRPGNSPIRGSARCAAGPAMPSTTSCFTAPAVWRSANCAARPSACRNPTPMRAGPRASAPNWPRAELERQGRISLCRSRRQPLHHHRRVKRLPVRAGARRRELSLLIATRKHRLSQLPAAYRGRDFFYRHEHRDRLRMKSPD